MAQQLHQQERESVITRRSVCRMCGGSRLTQVWSFGETPLANSYLQPDEAGVRDEVVAPLDVYYCQGCHLVQLLDIVSPHALFDHYLYVSSTSPTFVKHFEDYANTLMKRFALTEHDLVVDVGSNDGILLTPLQKAGVRVLGIDPAKNVAAQANRAGIVTVPEYFTPEVARRVREAEGPARIISANNVFAHTDVIDVFVSAVKELLTTDGVFVFEVQYLGDLIEKNLFDIVYHEHVAYYSVHPLIPYFKKHGLEVFDVERVAAHGGSIRVFVQHRGGLQVKTERLRELLALEHRYGLTTLKPYRAFADRIGQNKVKLQDLLMSIKKHGKKIVGYGAPAKATTLLSVFGLNGSVIDFIIDDSPLKQGMVMPGTHIPIVSSDRLYDQEVHYCILLAWNFAESIMKNHQRFSEQGGHFIVPVPEPKIITHSLH